MAVKFVPVVVGAGAEQMVELVVRAAMVIFNSMAGLAVQVMPEKPELAEAVAQGLRQLGAREVMVTLV